MNPLETLGFVLEADVQVTEAEKAIGSFATYAAKQLKTTQDKITKLILSEGITQVYQRLGKDMSAELVKLQAGVAASITNEIGLGGIREFNRASKESAQSMLLRASASEQSSNAIVQSFLEQLSAQSKVAEEADKRAKAEEVAAQQTIAAWDGVNSVMASYFQSQMSGYAGLQSLQNELQANVNKFKQGISELTSPFKAFSNDIVRSTLLMVGLGQGIMGVVNEYQELDTQAKRIQFIAGFSPEQTDTFVTSMAKLSTIIPKAQSELLSFAAAAAEAGVVGEENIAKFAYAVGELTTVAEGVNGEMVAEQLKKVTDSFGLSQTAIAGTTSVLWKASKDTVGGLNEYMAALVNLAPAANAFDLSLEQTSAILTELIPTQSSASRAGSRLSQLFLEMATKSDKLSEALGVTSQEFSSAFSEDPLNLLLSYLDVLEGTSDEVERASAAAEIFGQQSVKALLPLVGKQDAIRASFVTLTDEMKNGTSLSEDFTIAAQSLRSEFIKTKNTVMAVSVGILQLFTPAIKSVLSAFQSLGKVIYGVLLNIPDWLKNGIVGFVKWGTVIAIVVGAGMKLYRLVTTLLIPAMGIYAAISKIAAGTSRQVAVSSAIAAFGLEGEAAAAATAAATTASLGASALIVTGQILLFAGAAIAAAAAGWELARALNGGIGPSFMDMAKQKIGDVTKSLSNMFNVDDWDAQFENLKNSYGGFIEGLVDTTEDGVDEIDEALDGISKKLYSLAMQWGDDTLNKFLRNFTDENFKLLDDASAIAEGYFSILSQAGQITEETSVLATRSVRRLIAAAIEQMRDFGSISADVMGQITSALGADRAGAIAQLITEQINLDAIQASVDALESQISDLEKLRDDELDVIEKRIDAREQADADEIFLLEQSLAEQKRLLDEKKRLVELEKQPLEDQLALEEEKLDTAEDAYDVIKDAQKEEERIAKEELDQAKDRLESSKDTLKDLKEARQKDIDAAKGMVEYAKLNLDAAQEALETEKILGNDEYDASFRKATERVEAAQDQLELADENYNQTQNLNAEEVDLMEEQVSSEEATVESLQDSYDELISNHEAIVRQQDLVVGELEKQVAITEKHISNIEAKYATEIKTLERGISAQQFKLDQITSLRDQELAVLNKEKDTISAKYTQELGILNSRLTLQQTALNNQKSYVDKINNINNQIAQEMSEAQSAMGSAGDNLVSGIAGIGNIINSVNDKLRGLYNQIPYTIEQIGDVGDNISELNKKIGTYSAGQTVKIDLTNPALLVETGKVGVDYNSKYGREPTFFEKIKAMLGLADGGIVTGPTHALIGEGREDEAVLPLSQLAKIMSSYVDFIPFGSGFNRSVPSTVSEAATASNTYTTAPEVHFHGNFFATRGELRGAARELGNLMALENSRHT